MWRRLILIAPAAALTRCLFPSLDGLSSGDASTIESGADVSADVVTDTSPPADVEAGVGTYIDEVTADSPASWWRLGESSTSQPAADEMKVQAGAYQTPGVTLGAAGAIGKDTNTAASFAGTNGGVVLPGTLYDLGGAVPFAIEVWLAPGPPPPVDAGDRMRRVVSHRTNSPYFGWYMTLDTAQRVIFTRWDQNVNVDTLTSTPLVQDKYAHVVVSADGTTLSLYVNGALIAAAPESNITPDVAANALAWATQSDLGAEFFNGSMDEAAIYTHALAPARVLAHYQAGIAK